MSRDQKNECDWRWYSQQKQIIRWKKVTLKWGDKSRKRVIKDRDDTDGKDKKLSSNTMVNINSRWFDW